MFATKYSIRVLGGLVVLGGASLLAGCALANTNAATPTSAYGSTVPETYAVVSNNDVAKVVLDRSAEGIVLSLSLDEVAMPTTWAKVYKNQSGYFLYGTQVYPDGADAADYVHIGADYYVKKIRVGSTTATPSSELIFTAADTGSTVTWSATDGSNTVTLPDAKLSATYQKWYWAAMTGGNYSLRKSSDASTTLVSDSALANANVDTTVDLGATTANRWLFSTTDSAWQTGRDAAVTYLVGKNLLGTTAAALASSSGRWTIGTELTTVDTTWSLDSYWPTILTAFKTTSASTAVDATTSASE